MADGSVAGNVAGAWDWAMAKGTARLTIRNIDPSVRDRLRVRAARAGRSMEAELRVIVTEAVAEWPDPDERGIGLAESIRRRFSPFGGVDDLVIPPRDVARPPPSFDE